MPSPEERAGGGEDTRGVQGWNQGCAEFYLEMAGRFIHIRYCAVRGREGKCRGTLEVSQDATGFKGEKRLLDWE